MMFELFNLGLRWACDFNSNGMVRKFPNMCLCGNVCIWIQNSAIGIRIYNRKKQWQFTINREWRPLSKLELYKDINWPNFIAFAN